MTQSDSQNPFVEFTVRSEAALNRLSQVAKALQKQKRGAAIRDEEYWLPYFEASDRTEFWWPTKAEKENWNAFWFSTPLSQRHSPEMPTPPWDFGSMIDAIIEGEYDIVGVRKLNLEYARLEIDPFAYPYGGINSLRALVRSFGHNITKFDDGSGATIGDPQPRRWSSDSPRPAQQKKSFWDLFKRQ